MSLKEHLYVHDGVHLSVHESYRVFGQLTIEDYLHGRCHLMALALAEEAGLQCGVLLDLESGFSEDGEPITALDHAFCEMGQGLDGYVVDARGGRYLTEVLGEYNQGFEPEVMVGSEAEGLIRRWIAAGQLEDYQPGERTALALYVQELKTLPFHTLLPENSSWHNHEGTCLEITQPLRSAPCAVDSCFSLG